MSKYSNKITSDSKKSTNSIKHRDLSTDRNIPKSKAVLDNTNTSANTGKAKTASKQAIKTSTIKKSDPETKPIKQDKTRSSLPSTSSSNAIKKTTPTTSKSSAPVNRLASPANVSKQKKPTQTAPTSSRTSKTQYFPSKNMYSNAIQDHMQTKSKNNISTSKSNTKIVNKTKESTNERPKTATLTKSTVINKISASKVSNKNETNSSVPLNTEENDSYTYEDDFDSYESDFEICETSSSATPSLCNSEILEDDSSSSSTSTMPRQSTSAGTEEEKMFDSGNFDMPENKYKQLLHNIKESTEKDNISNHIEENNRSNMASLSDEGFEDGKSLLTTVQCINFVQAQKRIKHNKYIEKQKKRGKDILGMIRLDQYNFTLFEMTPVSYDVFIRCFGNINSKQIATQTGEDNQSEEIQTEEEELVNKWTQYPIKFSKIDSNNSNYLQIYKQEFAGVGSDCGVEKHDFEQEENHSKLENFLLRASQVIINLLYESQCNFSDRIESNSREIPFSSGFIKFNTQSFSFLKNKPITLVSYCSTNKILSVHGIAKQTDGNLDNEFSSESIICIWNILNSQEPEKILHVPGILNCCCFTSESDNLIIGGLCDGSLAIWNLGSSTKSFNNVKDKMHFERGDFDQPNYTSEINKAHQVKVVSIKQLLINNDNLFDMQKNAIDNQICSLDECGVLIIWIIITKKNYADRNLLHWNQLSIVQNIKMCLNDVHPNLPNLLCTDMIVNFIDAHHILISTNYGCILHCLTTTSKPRPKKYYSAIQSQINCLASCPFSSQYFLAGHEDGALTIYSTLLQKSLMALSNKNDHLQIGIEFIQWCNEKPCLFYVKDHSNTIHVWDLKVSDLYPVYSVPFKEKITAMKLSIPQLKENDASYMILATDTGSIHLHIISKDNKFGEDEYKHDVKNFFNYVNRL